MTSTVNVSAAENPDYIGFCESNLYTYWINHTSSSSYETNITYEISSYLERWGQYMDDMYYLNLIYDKSVLISGYIITIDNGGQILSMDNIKFLELSLSEFYIRNDFITLGSGNFMKIIK